MARQPASNSHAVVLSNEDLAALTSQQAALDRIDVDVGAQADAVATTDTGTFSLLSLFKRLLQTHTAYLGIVTETAPGSDTASSGLNGRLQRVAQRLTSLIGLLPTALGQGTMSQSLKVVVASDQSAVAVGNNALTTLAGACLAVTNAALTVVNVKSSAGNAYGLTVVNPNAGVIYLQFYNTAGTPTLGTGVIFSVPVAGLGVLVIPPGSLALGNFATGIGIGASTTAAAAGTPGSAPQVTVFYK